MQSKNKIYDQLFLKLSRIFEFEGDISFYRNLLEKKPRIFYYLYNRYRDNLLVNNSIITIDKNLSFLRISKNGAKFTISYVHLDYTFACPKAA